jgi:hypothetical protein
MIRAILGAALALLAAAGPALAAPPAPERPYSCRLLDDAARKCAFGACDQRERDRLTKECLRRPAVSRGDPHGLAGFFGGSRSGFL